MAQKHRKLNIFLTHHENRIMSRMSELFLDPEILPQRARNSIFDAILAEGKFPIKVKMRKNDAKRGFALQLSNINSNTLVILFEI